jgi:formyl-CoA transferase
VVAEAMGGLRHLTAEPGRVPVRVGVSIGDTLAALHGVIGILLALQERQRSGGPGDRRGAVRGGVQLHGKPAARVQRLWRGARPAGSALPGIAPSNAYRCADGGYADRGQWRQHLQAPDAEIGRDDLGQDPALADNAGRVARVAEIDAAIGAWTATRGVDEVLAALDARPCRPAASTPWPTSPPTRTTRRAA